MFSSAKYSYLALRLGLAAVFLWFGIDKIIHPTYWLNAWMTPRVAGIIGYAALSESQFIYLCGVFEILAGVSLATGIFSKFFSALAILFLIGVAIFVGSADTIVRDIGLVGGLIAVFLWPAPRNRF
jgi:uncharacterized membrane protein YphA (DoxX/SURF4 family)